MADASRIAVHVDGRDLELSNLDKVLYPATGFTKGEVIHYYTQIADTMHPASRRPGTDPDPLPERRRATGLLREERAGRDALVGTPRDAAGARVDDAPARPSTSWSSTVWPASSGWQTWPRWSCTCRSGRSVPTGPTCSSSTSTRARRPGSTSVPRSRVLLRERLAADGIEALPKTSGKKGMQLMAPISGTQSSDVVSAYAKRVAEELERKHPKLILSRMAKALRPGKVFIDWSQNAAAKTTVAPYSLRAEPAPTVSTPFTWDEVESGAVTPYESDDVLARIDAYGDLFAPLLEPARPYQTSDLRLGTLSTDVDPSFPQAVDPASAMCSQVAGLPSVARCQLCTACARA